MGHVDKGYKLFVRADADSLIGTGHVMRCIALAQACQKKGMQVVFVGRIESEVIRNRLSKEGFELVPVANSHPDAADLELFLRLLDQEENETRWTVLDGYHFSPDYQQAVHEAGGKLLLIDDCAHQKAYHADLLLNQNIQATRLNYLFDPATSLFGPRYALLRQDFLSVAKSMARDVPALARNILITLGGADPDNVAGMVLQAIRKINIEGLVVRIIVGQANPNATYIEELPEAPFDWEILRAVDDMSSIMAWADLAVSAGGSTCWELAFMGVPAAVVILAENQVGNAVGLHEYGAAVNCGWFHSMQAESLADTLSVLIEDRDIRQELIVTGQQLVDGKGAYRVAERMMPTDLCLRKALPTDCELIFQWANDPVIRAASFNMDPIAWDEHRRWFDARVRDKNSFFWIAVTGEGVPVGQVRFDVGAEFEAEISISLGPEFRGYGWGERLLQMACRELFRQKKVECIRALVKKDNSASQRSFEQAGFIKDGNVVRNGTPAISMSCRV